MRQALRIKAQLSGSCCIIMLNFILAYEDSLRGVYESTFMNESRAIEFISGRFFGIRSGGNAGRNEVAGNNVIPDKQTIKELAGFLVKSRGNHGVDILRVISDKDLRDARADVLLSHIRNTSMIISPSHTSSVNETASSVNETSSANDVYPYF